MFSAICFGQDSTIREQTDYLLEKVQELDMQIKKMKPTNDNINAGFELKKASTLFFTGIGASTIGTMFIYFGAFPREGFLPSPGLITVGSLIAGTGTIFTICAWGKIRKAGQILSGDKLIFYINPTSATLSYRF